MFHLANGYVRRSTNIWDELKSTFNMLKFNETN